jgi:hypothetical protein
MKVTGTREAFAAMLEEKAVYKKLEVSRGTVANWKAAMIGYSERQPPTLDKMEEMLLKYGASIEREKVWKLPTE